MLSWSLTSSDASPSDKLSSSGSTHSTLAAAVASLRGVIVLAGAASLSRGANSASVLPGARAAGGEFGGVGGGKGEVLRTPRWSSAARKERPLRRQASITMAETEPAVCWFYSVCTSAVYLFTALTTLVRSPIRSSASASLRRSP